MNIHDTEHTGGYEIDPNLVEIADMLRIQDEMHKLTEHAEDRMRRLISGRRAAIRPEKSAPARGKLPTKSR